VLSADLEHALVERFAAYVMQAAHLPDARRSDVEQAPAFSVVGGEIRCTCRITGSTYFAEWDGSEAAAARLADEAAEGTAFLVTRTPHYAWLRSSRDIAQSLLGEVGGTL
jgi:hypothetical protein